jgi:hypothetical protein
VELGFLQEENGWVLHPRNEACPPMRIEAVALIGAVEWSFKAGSKFLRPAEPAYEPATHESTSQKHHEGSPPA